MYYSLLHYLIQVMLKQWLPWDFHRIVQKLYLIFSIIYQNVFHKFYLHFPFLYTRYESLLRTECCAYLRLHISTDSFLWACIYNRFVASISVSISADVATCFKLVLCFTKNVDSLECFFVKCYNFIFIFTQLTWDLSKHSQ